MKSYSSFIAITIIIAFTGKRLLAQEYSPNRWKETQRLQDKDKKEIAYTDTLFLTYSGGEDIGIRKGGFVYNGKIIKNKLSLGYLEFDVLSKKEDEITLAADGNIHIFTRVLLDKSAADAYVKLKENELPTTVISAIDQDLLKGEWEAYRRVSRNGPMSQTDFKLLIKKAVFFDESQGGKLGLLYSTSPEDCLYAVTAIEGGTLATQTGAGETVALKVFKADGKELIIEDQHGVLYFMRKF